MSNLKKYLSDFEFTKENPKVNNLNVLDSSKVIEDIESLINTGQLSVKSRLKSQEKRFLEQKKIYIKRYLEKVNIIEKVEHYSLNEEGSNTLYGVKVENTSKSTGKDLYDLIYSYFDFKIDDLIKGDSIGEEPYLGVNIFEKEDIISGYE